ncbi:MAG: hypothetical protein JJU02_07875 [Cryomorphaceae bacterium]|nr:hypothetical protein [Cryomorphaceae bacterium]
MKNSKLNPTKIQKTAIGFFVLVFSLLFFQACINYEKVAGNTDLHSEQLMKIPFGAAFVVIDKENTSAENLYKEILERLTHTEHPIEMYNHEYYMVTTRGKEIRANRLDQRMEIRVRKTAFGARAVFETFHRQKISSTQRTSGMWAENQWDNLPTNLAFAETVSVADGIFNGIISYHLRDPFFFWESRVPIFDLINDQPDNKRL